MLSKAATTLSFLFAVLLLLSLPGAGSEGNLANFKRVETNTGVSLSPPPDSKTPAAAGFSYSRWLASGQPAAHENRTSGTFILKTAVGDIYRSRLTAAWRDVGARALNIEPLLRDELLLLANNKDSHWQSAWKNHREALLPALVDGTSDALLGGVLESGRALSWVRHLEVDFRTKLGKRPGSFGVNAILALHERADDATGLQLRGFFGNKFKGANAGVFYRRALGDNLLGGNVFLDYENVDVGGDFWRWSLGAEWRSPYVELYGNRYLGITGGKRQLVGGQYIYTADGTEVELALKAPYASWLSGVLSYYRWDGEYGDKVDKGFRYGIRADRRLGGFSFELQYEDPEVGKGSWGGRVSYSHDFAKGAESASSTQALTFDPRAHFFDAVRREYTQRIRKTAGNVFTGRIRISYLNGRATIVGSELTLQIYGSGETLTTELALIGPTVNAGVTTIVTGTVLTQMISPPNDYFITATALLTAFTRSPSTLRISVNNWEIELHSELVFASDSSTLLLKDGELMVTRNDGGISVVALDGRPTLNLENALIMVSIDTGGAVSLQLTEGLVSLMLNANNTLNALVRNGTLIVSLPANPNIDAELESAGNGLIVLLGAVTTNISPLAGRLVNASAVVATGYTSLVAQVTATGIGNLSYTLVAGGTTFAVGATNGSLSLTVAKSTPVTLTAMVKISDTGTLGVRASPVTVGYTVVVGEAFVFSPAQVAATITTYDNNRALLTASVAGALGAVVYTRISTNPASLTANFAVSLDGVVNVQQALTTSTMLSLFIRAAETINGAERLATLLLTVAVVDPPAFMATLNNDSTVILTGHSRSVAQVNSSGGSGDYTYGLPSGISDNARFRIGTTDGKLSLATAQSAPITLTAVVTVNDEHPSTPAVTLNLTVVIVDALGFSPNRVDITLTTHGTVPVALHTAVAVDPLDGTITYSLISTDPPSFTATINFTQSSEGGTVSLIAILSAAINASIYIRATTNSEKATLILALAAVDPPAFVATLNNNNPVVITSYSGSVAQVDSSGGAGTYTYDIQPAGGVFAVGTDGRVNLLTAQAAPTTLTAALVANDSHPDSPTVTLNLTLDVLAAVPAFVNVSGAVLTAYTGPVASIVNAPSGNWTLVAGGNHFTVGADGVLSLTTAAITVSSTLTASVVVDESPYPLITLGYILTVAPCSFFNGCQPFVNFAGAKNGASDNTGRTMWAAIDAPLARDLIAAGADVNEVALEMTNNSISSRDTPLLAAVRYSSPSVVSILLTAGASPDSLGIVRESDRFTYSDIGVFDYVVRNTASVDNIPNIPFLVSFFVANSVSVNLRTKTNNVEGPTPLDRYNGRNPASVFESAALIINAAGGKCLSNCLTVSGVRDITLAAVSFAPASLTAVAAATFTGDLYTVRAASGLGTSFDYQLLSTFPANLSSNFNLLSVDVNSARLSLNSAPGQDFSVYIEVTDQPSDEKATLRYILTVGACSFFSGCQPFVDHGANDFTWQTNLNRARDLINAGADIEEINLTTNRTPLLYVANSGGPQVAELFLDNRANVNAVHSSYTSPSRATHSNKGVLYYLADNGHDGVGQLLSLFVEGGANINIRVKEVKDSGLTSYLTPFDLYSGAAAFNFGKMTLLLPSTKSFGGKCLVCRTVVVDGVIVRGITLAAVSFSPASLTVTAAAAAAGDLYTVRAASGLGTLFNYQVVSTFPASLTSNFSLRYVDVNSAILSLKSPPGQEFSVYIEVTDVTLTGQPSGEKATLKYAFRESFSFSPSRIATTEVLDSYFGFAIYRGILNLSGVVKGLAVGTVTYSLLSTYPPNPLVSLHPHDFTTQAQRHNLFWTADPAVQTLSIFIKAADTAGNAATLTLSVAMVAPPALVVSLSGGMRNAIAAYTGPVAAVITSGGGGNNSGNGGTTRFSVVFGYDNFTVGAGGIISLTAVHNMPTVLTASIAVDNYYLYVDLVPTVTVGYTLSLVAKPALASIFFERVIFSYTGPVASITNVSSGGLTFVEGADNFRVGADGLLSLTAAIAVESTLTANIVVDLFPPLTLGYTLNVGACSFLDGCQPSVNFNGDNDDYWLLTVSQLRSLIAAGADVSEVRSAPVNVVLNSGFDPSAIMTTSISRPPLYLMMDDGPVEGALIMLDAASADVNVLVRGIFDGNWDADRGVFYYLSRRVVNNVEDTRQLIEDVIDSGANINSVRERFRPNETIRRTPLDHFNSEGAFRQFIYLIDEAGGKCFRGCDSRRGDVRLESVSFRPASLTVTAYRPAAANIHTVHAYSGLGTLFNYQVISVLPATLSSSFSLHTVNVHNAILSLNTALDFGQTVSIYIEATDQPSDAKATLRYDLIIPPVPAFVNASAYVLTAYTGAVASVANVPPGGTLSLVAGTVNFTVGTTDGVLNLRVAQNSAITLTASVQVSYGETPLTTLGHTLRVAERLRFSPAQLAATITTYDNNLVLLTASVAGALSAVVYTRIPTNPASFTANFTVFSGGVVSVQQALTTSTTLSLFIQAAETINGAERLATLLLTVAAVDPTAIMASLVPSNPVVVVTGYIGSVAQVNSSGGKGDYTYDIQPPDGALSVDTEGRVTLLTAVATPTILIATLVTDDEHQNTLPVTLNLTVEIADALGFAPVDITVTTYGTVPVALHTAVATNPNGGNLFYSLISTSPPGFSATINFTSSSEGGTVSLIATLLAPTSASIYIRATTDREKATLILALAAVDPPAFVATLNNNNPVVITGYIGSVAQVNSRGGAGDYTYAIQPAGGVFTVNTVGLINLLMEQDTPAILIATLVASDSHPDNSAVTLNLTLSLVAKPALANIFERVVFSYTGPVASITNVPSGSKLSVVFGGGNFTVGTDGLLSLTAAIAVESTLTASIVVDLFPPLTLGYTLTVGPCSFFGGCRPSVNYDGAASGALGNPGRPAWAAINASLARAIIAAGVDVNEVALEMTNNSISSRDTPLLAAVRYSSPSVVSILLTAGASPDSLGIVSVPDSDTYSDIGVFDYVVRNTAIVDNIPNIPLLVSLFVANSVDVNLRTKTNDVEGITPLDRFNNNRNNFDDNRYTLAANIIRAAGGKCLSTCLTVNGDITLAAVSFAPASLKVTASAAVAAGALYTVRAASGLGTSFNYRVSVFPASLSLSFDLLTVDVNSAILSLNSALGQPFSFYIGVTDQPSGEESTLRYYVDVCSFYDGCQPFVSYNVRYFGWQTTLSLARALINAGADIEEINSTTNLTPLLYVASNGNPQVAELFLDNGADLHVVNSFTFNYDTDYSNLGVFYYLASNDGSGQLLSVFAKRGANVNLVGNENGRDLTPLDFYNGSAENSLGNKKVLRPFIKSFGGKCLVCRPVVDGVLAQDIPLASVSFAPASLTVAAAATFTGNLYTVQAASGLGTRFSYQMEPPVSNFSLLSVDINSAILRLDSALEVGLYSVFVEVTDNNPLGDNKATLRYVHVARPYLANASPLVAPAYVGVVASVAGASSGIWALVSGGDNFTLGADGVLSLKASIGAVATLTASIEINESPLPLITLGYTLNVGACSFSKGCQFVNHNANDFSWVTNLNRARALINAGADIEEIIDGTSASKRTPLLYVADDGTRAVAELFLDNDANLHAVGSETHQGTGDKYSNFGVLSYMNGRGGIIGSDTLPLISLFVARGADVNHKIGVVRSGTTETISLTPLDLYRGDGRLGGRMNFGKDATAASLIKPFGAKCLNKCQSGDVRLESVSFASASVTVTGIGATETSANIYTVQVASGLGNSLSYTHEASQEMSDGQGGITTSNLSEFFELVSHNSGNAVILKLKSPVAGDVDITITATDFPSGNTAELYILLDRP